MVGGWPPIAFVFGTSAFIGTLLKVAWLISGVTAAYLLYRWYVNGMRVFGQNHTKDTLAFIVMIASGLNLGLVGLIGTNIGMTIAASRPVFIVVAIIYLFSAYYLYQHWKLHGEKLF